MSLNVITCEDCARWDAIVRTFSAYNVYYLSGYVKPFQRHGDGEPLLFFYEGDGIRGINVAMKRDIATDSHFAGMLLTGQWFDLSTPYGYGGWLLEGEGDPAPLFTAYESWCRKHHIISEFVRFQAMLNNHEAVSSYYDVIPLGHTVAMDLSSPEDIWANLSSDNRKAIRKAQRTGMTIYSGRSPELYDLFQKIYESNMEQVHAENYYYFSRDFYQDMLARLPHNAQVFYAQLDDGQIIAASIMFAANGSMDCFLSASYHEFQKLAPTNLMWYEAALWGCANGCRTLHVGGGVGSGEDSLYKFKKSFYRGEPHRFHIGRKIFLPDEYDHLVTMRSDLPDSGFFPRYRA